MSRDRTSPRGRTGRSASSSAQVLARPAGAPAGVGRAEEVAALEVGPARRPTRRHLPSARALSCTGERNRAADSCGSEDLEHLATRVVVARAFEFVHLPVLMTLSSPRPPPARSLGESADLGDRHPPFRAQRRLGERQDLARPTGDVALDHASSSIRKATGVAKMPYFLESFQPDWSTTGNSMPNPPPFVGSPPPAAADHDDLEPVAPALTMKPREVGGGPSHGPQSGSLKTRSTRRPRCSASEASLL